MARPIDADAVEKVLTELYIKRPLDSDRWVIADIKKGIMDLQTIDAVPVIRCKDCARNPKNRKARTICPCPMDRYIGDEGYCSKAEPK